MKTIELRRHSFRKQGGGSQLSQQGVTYARHLGATMGPFAYVVTSVVPRARETAIAMGFAVTSSPRSLMAPLLWSSPTPARLKRPWWFVSPTPTMLLGVAPLATVTECA